MKSIALRNSSDQSVYRVVYVEKGPFYVVRDLDSDRIEFLSDAKSVQDRDGSIEVIARTSFTALEKKPMKLSDNIELASHDLKHSVYLRDKKFEEDSTETLTSTFKWSSLAHVGMLALIFLISGFIKPLVEEDEKVTVVTIEPIKRTMVAPGKTTPKSFQKPVKSRKTERRVVRSKVTKKRANNVAKTARGNNSRRGKPKATRSRQASQNYSSRGALGALNKVASKGTNTKVRVGSASATRSQVSGRTGTSSARSVLGKALVQSSQGKGLRVGSTGSYSNAGLGKGGNSAGSGPVYQGKSDGYLEPLSAQAIVRGGLTKDQIASVIQRNLGQVLYCYEKGLQTDPRISGRVAVDFVISPRGSVSQAQIGKSSVASNNVEGCIVNKMRAWKFPKPVGNLSVKVSYPFLLRRSS